MCLISVTEYYKMPKIYHLDDYDKCLSEESHQKSSSKSVYCFVDVVIKPNKSSTLWSTIEVCSSYFCLMNFLINIIKYSRNTQIKQKLDSAMII